MGNCKICGEWIDEGSSSAINDICSKLSCWKEAHPQLFQNQIGSHKLKITRVPTKLHEEIKRVLGLPK